MNDDTTTPADPVEPEDWDDLDDAFDPAGAGDDVPGPPRPVNWNLLLSHDLEQEWLALNRWVEWLRHTYALPASVIPPLWHRHPELLWELSALHLHWLAAYDPEQNASAPIGWHRDFAAARQRLRDWVAASGTRLDRDRPSRQTAWPGEPPAPTVEDTPIEDRRADFVQYVIEQVARRKAAEDSFFAGIDYAEGDEQ
jgi:hypothetical protein